MFSVSRRNPRPAGAVPVWAACAALLDYPTAELVEGLDQLESLVPDPHLRPVFAHLRSRSLDQLQADYVATFDNTRRCAPYLTYYLFGDTRRRGVALVQFKQAYRRGGMDFTDDELPDHLCAVLQFGAIADPDAAWRLLNDYRSGIEMLRIALVERDSPWAGVLGAVCATLPVLKGDEADAVRRLIEQGPPAEEVGLDGYAPAARDADFLGMPR